MQQDGDSTRSCRGQDYSPPQASEIGFCALWTKTGLSCVKMNGGVAELVECTGLENRRTFARTVGSNPTPSAKQKNAPPATAGWALFYERRTKLASVRLSETGPGGGRGEKTGGSCYLWEPPRAVSGRSEPKTAFLDSFLYIGDLCATCVYESATRSVRSRTRARNFLRRIC